ncbi:uncharacterized protein LOC128643241 [Bombina bombina]|uniref:uncharacterized protein LOC128643241 n=1 Tax=Bombina bombina TaxID=8345 RepID=UPI00235B303D|nr:uncharacterized protein LOC128643241 [Bombina bombina]
MTHGLNTGVKAQNVYVTALYSSIPHEKGMEALAFFFREWSEFSAEFQTFILLVSLFLLTHNFFEFEGTFYLQRYGTAMGAKFAPYYANLFMGWWELSLIFGDSNPHKKDISFYCQFIDDLILIWDGSEADLEFVEGINQNKMGLKFTFETQLNEINFLDVTLSGTLEGKVKTNLYRKPISGNSLLHARSCHPKHVLYAIAKGQFIRAKRNCSDIKDCHIQMGDVSRRLVQRGYPQKIVKKAHREVVGSHRSDLLRDKSKTKEMHKGVTFVTDYSSQYEEVCKIVKHHFSMLIADDRLIDCVQEGIRCSYWRNRTLGNLLSPTVLKKPTSQASDWLTSKGSFKCGSSRCGACDYLIVSDHFNSTVTGKTYEVNFCLNCTSVYVIYCITCTKCGKQYVGLTRRDIRTRVREHLSTIRVGKATTPLCVSFCTNTQ